jgi:hypothetical protein|tara:strand:+ start:381 stop:1112 length:732 start_codon:yes stop_codon:yes gene_type:complete
MLTVTDKLAYWHMPKTGGMSVYKVLQACGNKPEWVGGVHRHGPVSQLPQSALAKRALFGTVRDPWSWYTSLYQHASSNPDGIANLKVMGNGDSSFKAVLRSLTDPQIIAEPPNPWGLVIAYGEAEYADWKASGLGLCSWMFRYVYGSPNKLDLFVDTAGLYEGLSEIMNVPLETIQGVNPQNCAAHRPKSHIEEPAALYDDEMKEWVAKADQAYIQMFEYEFFTRPDWTVLAKSDVELAAPFR